MTKHDWSKIKIEYVEGNITLEELSKIHGVSFSTLRKRSGREGWTSQKNIYRTKLEQKRQERKSTILASEAAGFDASCLRPAQSAVELIEKRLAEIKKKGTLSYDDTKELDRLSSALKAFQAVGKLALGEDPEDKKANALQSWADFIKMIDVND